MISSSSSYYLNIINDTLFRSSSSIMMSKEVVDIKVVEVKAIVVEFTKTDSKVATAKGGDLGEATGACQLALL